MFKAIDKFTIKLADWVIRHRWLVIALTLITFMASASGMHKLEFSNNFRVFFSKENPELIAFDNLQTTYTKSDNILFIVQPADGTIFQAKVTQAIERLTERAWQIPFTIRVDSISNFQHSWADGDDLTVEDLLHNSGELTKAQLEEKQSIALAEPLLRNNLLSDDADTTGVNVTLQYPELRLKEVPEAVAVARDIAAEMRAAYPELTIAISGFSLLNNAFSESGERDLKTLIPIMYLVLIVIMVLTLRSVSGTIATLFVIGMSSMTAMGLAGHIGIKLNPVSVASSTIILTLAIADSIHILVSMQKLMKRGRNKRDAIQESIRINAIPVTITSLTTVVGFLGLNFSDAPPFRNLGNITAMGISSAWVYAMVFLPAIISVLPFRIKEIEKADASGMQWFINKIGDFVTRHYTGVGLLVGGMSIAFAVLAPRVELNDEWIKYFDYRLSIRKDVEFGMKHLGGPYSIEFSLESGEEGGISDPDYLNNLEAFTAWLRVQPEATHVYSYADIIKRLNKNLHHDDSNWYRIPDERDLAAQYLLLYELSLPFGLDLNDRINVDKSATRVSVSLPEISTARVRAFAERAKTWLSRNTPESIHAEPTGPTIMFSHISQRNIEGMLKGNIIAIGMIVIIMMISLQSWKLGALSIIPNTMPVLVTFGIWALFVGQVGMASATVTSSSLGIIVDDTVHFLSKYLRARREEGMDQMAAVKYAFDTVGKAIVITTIILSLGFGVLATSTFRINAHMGLMTAIAIIAAWVLDFTLLPALLLIGYKKKRSRS